CGSDTTWCPDATARSRATITATSMPRWPTCSKRRRQNPRRGHDGRRERRTREMTDAPRPRLVVERWTDPAAGDVLELSGIDIVKLDLTAPAESGWAALESAHGYQVATRTDVAAVGDGAQWLAGEELIARCPSLLAVCSAGAGYDVIDVDACTRAGVAVCNNSGPGAEAVAEHALGFMLDLAKKITAADRALRSGPLGDRLALRGSQLLGKTLGVVGLGAIGRRL